MSIRPVPSPLADCRLWRVDLDAAPAPLGLAALSPAEQARAARFVFERDRVRFVAAHAALRQLLGQHTGIAPAALEFVEGEFGKPALAGAPALAFNLSHSHAVGLIGIGVARGDGLALGVDVELRRPVPDALELAGHYFTAAELASLQAQPAAARETAFLVGWTRKEALLKALGLGLTVDLRRIDVGLTHAQQSVKYVSVKRSYSLNVVSVPMADDDILAAIAISKPETMTKELAAPERARLELLP